MFYVIWKMEDESINMAIVSSKACFCLLFSGFLEINTIKMSYFICRVWLKECGMYTKIVDVDNKQTHIIVLLILRVTFAMRYVGNVYQLFVLYEVVEDTLCIRGLKVSYDDCSR